MVVISFVISSISPKSFSFLLISYMYFYYNEAIILTCSSFWECFPFVHCVTVILIFFVEQMAQWLRKHQLKKQHPLSLPLKQNPVLLQLCLVSFIPQILTSPESVHSPLPPPPPPPPRLFPPPPPPPPPTPANVFVRLIHMYREGGLRGSSPIKQIWHSPKMDNRRAESLILTILRPHFSLRYSYFRLRYVIGSWRCHWL